MFFETKVQMTKDEAENKNIGFAKKAKKQTVRYVRCIINTDDIIFARPSMTKGISKTNSAVQLKDGDVLIIKMPFDELKAILIK